MFWNSGGLRSCRYTVTNSDLICSGIGAFDTFMDLIKREDGSCGWYLHFFFDLETPPTFKVGATPTGSFPDIVSGDGVDNIFSYTGLTVA